MRLTPQEEKELNTLFESTVNLVRDSILPDYIPNVTKELIKFINYVQTDIRDGLLEFTMAQQLAVNLKDYFWQAIMVNQPESKEMVLQIRDILNVENVGARLGCSKWHSFGGLIAGGCALVSWYFYLNLLSSDESVKAWESNPILHWTVNTFVAVTSFGAGLLGNAFGPTLARKSLINQFTRVTFNTRLFFNFAKNYSQFANKIFRGIKDKISQDNLIDLISVNIRDVNTRDKVIKHDIAEAKQERFLRRLLDTHVNANDDPLHKVTLRQYLRDAGKLNEVTAIVRNKVFEILRENSDDKHAGYAIV